MCLNLKDIHFCYIHVHALCIDVDTKVIAVMEALVEGHFAYVLAWPQASGHRNGSMHLRHG